MTIKKTKIIFWVSTTIIFLLDGLMPAFTSNSPLAIDGIRHLGYPDYFRIMLTVFKVTAAIVLVLPFFELRFKEWAYTGFAITYICATVSSIVVDGFTSLTFLPVTGFMILIVSYLCYHKLIQTRSHEI